MRTRTIAAALLAAALPLTACGTDNSSTSGPNKTTTPTPSETVDCTDENLSQADWMKHCADDEPGTGGDGQPATLEFGEAHTWPDGLKATITEAKILTDFSEYASEPDPDLHAFRLSIKVTNTGKTPVDIGELFTNVEGATNGGESTLVDYGADPLEGRLAPGVTAVKGEDHELDKQYGKKIVVILQRATENYDETYESPEFTGTITD
ncbi:MAG TPA: hypothetical protein VFY14_04000 [Streptomyces sp.]|nr:hypothetical protein [Streptomyces sp.]